MDCECPKRKEEIHMLSYVHLYKLNIPGKRIYLFYHIFIFSVIKNSYDILP